MIRKAKEKDIREALEIAKKLKEWFTKQAIKNMKIDFLVNNLIIATNRDKVIGFLCYYSNYGKIKIIWMGVKRGYQRTGVGGKLLGFLSKNAKKIKSKKIEVETLTERENYKPYESTRAFYNKYGFKKVWG